MKRITVTFTTDELALLSSLAADQLFRKEFIDPRLPGFRSNRDELSLGKQLVERLRGLMSSAAAPIRRNTAPIVSAEHRSKD